jgi:hypothetical protein
MPGGHGDITKAALLSEEERASDRKVVKAGRIDEPGPLID